MPRRGHTHSSDEEPDAPSSRPRGSQAGPRSVDDAHNSLRGAAEAGRVGGPRPTSSELRSAQPDHLITRMTGEPHGVPDGHPTRIGAIQDNEVRRSLEMENSGAVVLADRGFQIQQNPTPAEVAQARQETGDTGKARSKPDYLLEGRVFDCYSPTNPVKAPRGIWYEVEKKILDNQTQRVVVNLEDWRGDVAALRHQFENWPIDRLKEVKAITPEGDIIQIIPNQEIS